MGLKCCVTTHFPGSGRFEGTCLRRDKPRKQKPRKRLRSLCRGQMCGITGTAHRRAGPPTRSWRPSALVGVARLRRAMPLEAHAFCRGGEGAPGLRSAITANTPRLRLATRSKVHPSANHRGAQTSRTPDGRRCSLVSPVRLKCFDLCPHQLALIGQKRPANDRRVWQIAGKLPD